MDILCFHPAPLFCRSPPTGPAPPPQRPCGPLTVGFSPRQLSVSWPRAKVWPPALLPSTQRRHPSDDLISWKPRTLLPTRPTAVVRVRNPHGLTPPPESADWSRGAWFHPGSLPKGANGEVERVERTGLYSSNSLPPEWHRCLFLFYFDGAQCATDDSPNMSCWSRVLFISACVKLCVSERFWCLMCKMGDGDIVLLDLASSAVSFHPPPRFTACDFTLKYKAVFRQRWTTSLF